jgi:hypothetical protein
MSADWMAGGPQKAFADFNLRTHSTNYQKVNSKVISTKLNKNVNTKYGIFLLKQ